MRLIIESYYFTGAFLAGVLWKDIQNDDVKYYSKILALLIILNFGVVMYSVQYSIEFLKWIKDTFELGFFYKFYFTNKFNKVDEEYLKLAISLRDRSKYVKRFMVSLAVKAIAKRLNPKP